MADVADVVNHAAVAMAYTIMAWIFASVPLRFFVQLHHAPPDTGSMKNARRAIHSAFRHPLVT